MALVAFDQEPGGPEGLGTFHFDDGRSLFAHDPETASKLPPAQPANDPQMEAAYRDRGQDRMTAQAPKFPTTDQRLDAGGPAPGNIDEQLGAMNFKAPQGPAAPQGAPAAPMGQPEGAVGGGPQPPGQAQTDALKFITAPKYVAPTRGGVVPKSQSATVEQEGLPYDPALAQQRQDANTDLMVAKQNTAKTLADRSMAESLHAQAQLPALQQQAAKAQQEVAAQQDAYKAERADLEKAITESETSAKSFNANHWFESKGAIGQIGAVFAQAMGAYAATLGHTENWAQKIINQYIDQDIATQKEQIAAAKGNANNALAKLNRRYGDMGQAEAALKMAMSRSADTQALAYAKSTGSQDILNTWQEQVAKNTADRTAEEQKFMAGALGKRTTATQAQIVAPRAGGMVERTDEEQGKRIQNLKGMEEVGAAPDISREGRALDMKQRADEAKKKANPAIAKTQDQLDAVDSSLRNAEELDKLYAKPGILSRAERGRMEYLQSVSPMEVHKALTGMSRFTEYEGEQYATAYGHRGETLDYTGKHRAALGSLREDLAHRKAALQKQLANGGGAPADEGEAIKDVE